MSKGNLDRTIETLGVLTHGELIELQTVIADLLEVGYLDPAGAKKRARGTAAKGSIERRIVSKTLSDGTVKQYGPYKYLKVWRDGKLTSKYLGKAGSADLPAAQDVQPTGPTPIQIALDWHQRDALRYAAEKPEIWRDNRTKRGVHSLCLLGLLVQTRTTATRAYYAITEAGRAVAAQLPTPDEEWADMPRDIHDPAKLGNRRYSAAVDPRVVARLEAERQRRVI
jgi:hypothetical protein